jgi:hypothetical protein
LMSELIVDEPTATELLRRDGPERPERSD